jgi:hypothetical protein
MLSSPPGPQNADVAIFNTGDGTVEVLTAPGTGRTLAIDRGTFTAPSELTNHPPQAPGGPPDFKGAVSRADLSYRQIVGANGQAFITTPATCPRSRAWISQISYSTSDGRSYHLVSSTPCRPRVARRVRHKRHHRRHHRRHARHRRHRLR